MYPDLNPTTKELHFSHYQDPVIRLNNGSFGCSPKQVLDVQSEVRRRFLARPDQYQYSGELDADLDTALAAVTSFFKPQDHYENRMCFTENATVATAIVARYWATNAKPGRQFLVVTDCVYGAAVHAYAEYLPRAFVMKLNILHDDEGNRSFPSSKAELLNRFKREWSRAVAEIDASMSGDRNNATLYCHLDYISSAACFLFPVNEMLAHARTSCTYPICTYIDAAQTFLHPHFDLVQEFGDPDFASINLHKWNFAPISAAVLYYKTREVSHVIPSWRRDEGLAAAGSCTGTRDYSAYLAAPAALAFQRTWRSAEGETASQYCRRNLMVAVERLAHAWGTTEAYLPGIDVMGTSMAMVKLPDVIPPICTSDKQNLRTILREEYNIECRVAHFEGMGNYLRLSFAIYNTQEDILGLERAICHIGQKYNDKYGQ